MARDRFLEFRAFREFKQGCQKEERHSEEQRLGDLGSILNAAIEESSPSDTLGFLQITRFFDQERTHKLTEVVSEFEDMFSLAPSTPAPSAPNLTGLTLFTEARSPRS
jgi:hypothetical protein